MDVPIEMDPLQKQMLDDVFDAFQMLVGGHYVTLMHVEGGFSRFSPAAVEMFGMPGEYFPNGAMDWNDYLHPEDRKRYRDVMSPLLRGERVTYDLTYRVRVKNGAYVSFRAVGAVLRNEAGKPSLIGGALINQGVMENTDPITILPNKYAYFEALERVMEGGGAATSLLLGVSHLAELNAGHGYNYGNRILREVAWLVQETVNNRGEVFRVDDAGFCVLSETLSPREMAAVYDTLRMKLQQGIRVDGARHNLSAAGSLVTLAGTRTDPATVYACLGYAYRESKLRRHGELVDFNGSVHYDRNQKLELLYFIRDCILDDCQGFFLSYQPVVSAATGRISGAEALVRWRKEPWGRVEPGEFVPELEDDFVFEELGTWIMCRAMEDGLQLLRHDPDFRLSVNVSSSELEEEYFLDHLVELLRKTGFPAHNLSVELTRSCRLLDMAWLRETAEKLRRLGIRVGIDDFGTGYESLGFLKELAPDFVKFDRRLLEGIDSNRADRETMEFMVRCAGARGAEVIVKGVETPETREFLKGLPVAGLQGNLYAKPESCQEIIRQFYS